MGQQLVVVVAVKKGMEGKLYRCANQEDERHFREAALRYKEIIRTLGDQGFPSEPITPDRPSPNSRGLSAVVRYGLERFGDLYNDRQLLAMTTFSRCVRLLPITSVPDEEYSRAIKSYLALSVSRLSDYMSTLCIFNNVGGRGVVHTFGRQALQMVWDYPESSPINDQGANWEAGIDAATGVITKNVLEHPAIVVRGSADRLAIEGNAIDAIFTDPPYYDSVPYGDLSDYFYVWIKRSIGDSNREAFTTLLTPKTSELIAYYGSGRRRIQKPPEWYESGMRDAFREMARCLGTGGICSVMFAHKSTSAWETLIAGLLKSGLMVTASWPVHTERKARLVARNAAALASSVTLVCRKRIESAGSGFWDDVRQELKIVAQERLDFFWRQSIRGADFFISAIGPALSVFGKYERVTKLSGEEITVGRFLDEVRGLVTGFALTKILKTTHTGTIDPESRFYVVWKWSYGEVKVPADESFKLAQALGMNTDSLWDKIGVLEKVGENVLATPISKRVKIKNLGEPAADGTPASLIDVLHRMCAFREKGDTDGMAEYLARSGQGKNATLWLVAQAVSETLPDGDKEKQLMQGLLNQREKLEREEGLLF